MGQEEEKAVQTHAADGSGPSGETPQPSKRRRKWPIVIGVVAAVCVVGGIGFNAWHSQPSFCNAVCHTPMDHYVTTYYGTEGQEAHAHMQAGTTCLDCHEATFDEQVNEAVAWVGGDYATNDDGSLTTTLVHSDEAMCAKSGCHDMDEVVASTQDWGGQAGVNPHQSHQGYEDCSDCHVSHGQSVMYCNTCHDYQVPDGWAQPEKAAPTSPAQGE